MTIKQVNYYEVVAPQSGMRNPGKIQILLDEFVTSGLACVEVENLHHKNINSARPTFCQAVKRYGMPHIKVVTKKGKLYLVNTILIDKKKIE